MPRKRPTHEEDVEVTELEGPVVVEETTPDGETNKVIETPGPVTIEETLPSEPKTVTTVTVPVRQGTVALRYTGESPVRAVQNVPSGAKYRIGTNGVIIVYQVDAAELLTRPDFAVI